MLAPGQTGPVVGLPSWRGRGHRALRSAGPNSVLEVASAAIPVLVRPDVRWWPRTKVVAKSQREPASSSAGQAISWPATHGPAPPASAAAPAPPPPSPALPPATDADTEAARRGLATMAQLANAWAQVSSRLSPIASLEPADSVAAAAAVVHQTAGSHGEYYSGQQQPGQQQQQARWALPAPTAAQPIEAATASASMRAPGLNDPPTSGTQPGPPSAALLAPQPQPASWPSSSHPQTRLPPSSPDPFQHPPQPPPEQHYQHKQQQHHFEAIITALKLALASLQSAPPRRDGRSPATRAVQLASTLADLCAAGLPLDAFAMCAGVVAEAADVGALRHDVIRAQLGPSVAALVHDMLRVRQAPRRIELLDDEGSSAVREWCLAFHDVRACAVEVVCWWDELQHMGGLPLYEQQALALEALQIGAPMGHALGLGPLSALMEDMALKVLFPDSYASTASWLRGVMDPAEDALFAAQQRLLSALDAHPGFARLAGGVSVKARTKSLFSVMKKLLHLGDLSRGGRSREELYDLLGMRAIVHPPDYLPPDEAEAAAAKACYIVQDVASTMWRPVPRRSKDYIVAPKANGYQSIHLTLQLGQLDMVAYDAAYGGSTSAGSSMSSFDGPSLSYDAAYGDGADALFASQPPSSGSLSDCSDAAAEAEAEAAEVMGSLCLELQIRTAAMDRAAESGDAAHAVYKGGLDARTARQLQAWTSELRTRLASQPRGRLLLRAASSGLNSEDAQAAAARRRRRKERRASAAAAATSASATPPVVVAAAAAAAAIKPAHAGESAAAKLADTVAAAVPVAPAPAPGTSSGASPKPAPGRLPALMPPPRRGAGSLASPPILMPKPTTPRASSASHPAAPSGRTAAASSAGRTNVPDQRRLEQEQQQKLQAAHQQQQREQAAAAAAAAEAAQMLLFSSLTSVDEPDEPYMIGLPHRDAAAAAEQLFRHLDVNRDGRLSLGEVRQVLSDLAAPSSERDAVALMSALDRNGDGGVSMEEFVEGVRVAQQQQEGAARAEEGEQRAREAQEERRRAAAAAARRHEQPQWQPWQHPP